MQSFWWSLRIAGGLAIAGVMFAGQPAQSGAIGTQVRSVINIGFLRPELSPDQPDEKHQVIADIVFHVLAQELRRELGTSKTYVRRVNKLPFTLPKQRPDFTKFVGQLKDRRITLVVAARVNLIPDLGYQIEVTTLDGQLNADDLFEVATAWREGGRVEVIQRTIPPDADFRSVEEQIKVIATEVALRIIEGRRFGVKPSPQQTVQRTREILVWCFDTDLGAAPDLEAAQVRLSGLARRITVDLPFHLNKAVADAGAEHLRFSGLTAPEYFVQCILKKSVSLDIRGLGLKYDIDPTANTDFLSGAITLDSKNLPVAKFFLTVHELRSTIPLGKPMLLDQLVARLSDPEKADGAYDELSSEVAGWTVKAVEDIMLEKIDASFEALETAIVREFPTVDSRAIKKLPGGKTVQVVGLVRDSEWYKVRLGDGKLGFIRRDLLRKIK